MSKKHDIPHVPDVQLPDADSPRRRGAGILLLLAAMASATACVIAFGLGWLGGGIDVLPLHTPTASGATDEVRELIVTPIQTATAPPAEATPTVRATKVPPVITQRQLRVLNTFTKLVRERYVYTDYNGIDWDHVSAEAEKRVRGGMSDDDFYAYLADRIDDLGDEHSVYLSPADATDEDSEYAGDLQYAGVGVVTFPLTQTAELVVLQVFADSPAEVAGIRPHDRIVQIDGQPAIDADGYSNAELFRGEAGTKVRTIVRAPDGAERSVDLVRAQVEARERVEHRIIEKGGARVGYISIPTLFEDDIDARVREALLAIQKDGALDGIILDVRINGGGALDVLQPTLGFFTRGSIGNLFDRTAGSESIDVRAENVGASQKLPLIVLIGPATESYAEVFAAALQYKGRAVLIGQRTAGNIETLHSHEFEDGSRLWLAEESFRLPSGKSWEGVGLEPDMTIDAQWHEYSEETDPVLGAAMETFAR